MKRIFQQTKLLAFLGVFLLQHTGIQAQIRLKTEYVAATQVKDAFDRNLAENTPLQNVDLWMRIPITMKYNKENQLVKASFVSLWAVYTNLNLSEKFPLHSVSEVCNVSLSFGQYFPLHEQWFALLMLGGGIFTTDVSEFLAKNAFVQGGGLLIHKQTPALEWGIGASVNNAYQYAMFSPAFMLRWRIHSEYLLRLFFYNSLDFEFSKQISQKLKLGVASEVQVLLATADYKEKQVAFGSQVGHLGIRPEIKIGKHLLAQITGGLAFSRNTYFDDTPFRVFYNVFKNNQLSPYFALGIKYDH